MVVGVDTVVVVVVAGAFVLAAVVLVLLVAAPWRSVREEPPLDADVETRLLLGEDPEQIAADVDAAEARQASIHPIDAGADTADEPDR
jgi:hypothetical protein